MCQSSDGHKGGFRASPGESFQEWTHILKSCTIKLEQIIDLIMTKCQMTKCIKCPNSHHLVTNQRETMRTMRTDGKITDNTIGTMKNF